jgi:hypothetical protein
MFGNQIVVGHSIMADIDSLYKIEWKYKSSNFKSMEIETYKKNMFNLERDGVAITS